MTARARILQVLDQHGADSANPMAAGDLLAVVGGSEPAAWAELEGLVRERQVMTCHITRGGEHLVVFWPMGKIVTERSRAIARNKSAKGGHLTARRSHK